MTKIIAEVGSNWEPGKIESALAMVRLAAECGADLVKFQDWAPLEDFDRPDWWKEQHGRWTLSTDWKYVLNKTANECGVQYMTSVFTKSAVERVAMFSPYKIASGEIGNQELLLHVNRQRHPEKPRVYLSVPSTRIARFVPALTWLWRCSVTLLFCMANDEGEIMYPADHIQDLYFNHLRDFGLPVGLSSHLPYDAAIEQIPKVKSLAAVELHLRSHDTPQDAPDNGDWALYPEQFKEVVEAVNG